MSNVHLQAEQLVRHVAGYDGCLVAFSGGVDSSVVAQAARLAWDDRAIAVTGESAAVAEGEIDVARRVAQQIGIRHEVLATAEFANARYTANPTNRCYFCKDELYTRLGELLARFGVEVMVNGANADDYNDHRPGMIAAAEHQVRSPLAECGFTKAEVRELARHWKLPVWDKPATPCLASRVAYGEEVTPQRLRMIDLAEQYLRGEGFPVCRVRYHRDDLAR
ncbi:MAG: ATP-dependent sacrificial sulfur transferase LarE, partial [Pirellulales bacterium]